MRKLVLLVALVGCSTPRASTSASTSSAPRRSPPRASRSATLPPVVAPTPDAPPNPVPSPRLGPPDPAADETQAELTLEDGCGPSCPVEILFVTSPEPTRPAQEAGAPIAAAYRDWRDCIGFVPDSVAWRAQLSFEVDPRGRGRLLKVDVTPRRPDIGRCLARAWPELRWPSRPKGKRARISATYRRMAAHGHPPPR